MVQRNSKSLRSKSYHKFFVEDEYSEHTQSLVRNEKVFPINNEEDTKKDL